MPSLRILTICGQVRKTHALITFQGKSMEKLFQNFQNVVDDSICWCEKNGKYHQMQP